MSDKEFKRIAISCIAVVAIALVQIIADVKGNSAVLQGNITVNITVEKNHIVNAVFADGIINGYEISNESTRLNLPGNSKYIIISAKNGELKRIFVSISKDVVSNKSWKCMSDPGLTLTTNASWSKETKFGPPKSLARCGFGFEFISTLFGTDNRKNSVVCSMAFGGNNKSKLDSDLEDFLAKMYVHEMKKVLRKECSDGGRTKKCLNIVKNVTRSYGDYFASSSFSAAQINKRLFDHETLMMEYAISTDVAIKSHDKIEGESIGVYIYSILKSHNANGAPFLENETNGVVGMHLNFSEDSDVIVLHCIYKNISKLLDSSSRHEIDSDIHSLKLFYNKTDMRNSSRLDAVVLCFKNKGINRSSPLCLFLHPTKLEWVGDGMSCKENAEYTECHSNHLTHFGVFSRVDDAVPLSSSNRKALEAISYIGCVLSLVGISIMLILYFAFRKDFQIFSNDRYLINLNLLIALGSTQILFLIGIVAIENETSCQAVAILLHYFTLASLAWMVVEGVVLYLKVIKVYGGEDVRLRYFFIAAWGLPVVMVTLTASIHLEGYSSEHWCWLSFDDYSVWSMFGPVAAVILINFIILVLVVKTVIVSASRHANTSSTCASVRAVLILFPILGLSWVFGLFALNFNSVVWQYLFVIFNGIQGFLIFIIYGVGKSEIRSALKKLCCTLPVNTPPQVTSHL